MPRDIAASHPPRWVIALGSVFVLFHLGNAVIAAWNVPSGPWGTNFGPVSALPPQFARVVGDAISTPYSQMLKVNEPFSFESNRQEMQEVSFEVVLRDSAGKIIGTQKYPDPNANVFVRSRQWQLAHRLRLDEPLPPQQGVVVAPFGQELPALYWWQPDGERRYKLQKGNANTAPRAEGVMRPGDRALLVAQAYTRYLRREHGAASVVLTRVWRDPVLPNVVFEPQLLGPDTLKPFQSSYGELAP